MYPIKNRYAWAVPALYQRYGAVLLLAAALLAQVPLLGVGSWLWRDARTQSLGGIFTTLGTMGTPLTVLGMEAVALSLGFYPGRPRDWHPRPFKYLLDTVHGIILAQSIIICTQTHAFCTLIAGNLSRECDVVLLRHCDGLRLCFSRSC